MQLPIVLRFVCFTASQNHALSTLVKNLSDARMHALLIETAVKADSDKARWKIGRRSRQAPRRASRLIVESGVKIPCPCCWVLKLPHPASPSQLLNIFIVSNR